MKKTILPTKALTTKSPRIFNGPFALTKAFDVKIQKSKMRLLGGQNKRGHLQV